MRALVRVELTRLRWRRAVVLLLLAAVVVPALIAASRLWSTRPVSDADYQRAVDAASSEIATCEDTPSDFGLDEPAGCERQITGWYVERQSLSLAEERGGSGAAVVAILTLLLLLAGTTFAGHDWNTGSMANQLLFEPRRHRVWAAKAVAVTGSSLLVALVVSSAYWLTIWTGMVARDLPRAPDALLDSLAYGGRGALLAAAGALGGFALTTLLRSTVATIGLLFFATVVGIVLISALGVSERWQPQVHAQAIVANGADWEDYDYDCVGSTYSGCSRRGRIGPADGIAYYGIPLLVVGAASLLSFRRRDIP